MTEEDHQHKSPSNLSHYRYIRVGQIEKYNQRTGFANITLNNGYLTQNDDIIIMGNNTDTYVHQKAKIIKFKEKKVHKTPRGTKEKPLLAELRIDGKVISNGEDKIYVFTDRTYKKRTYSL